MILGAVAAILLPFISETLLTLALGGIAFSEGVSQLLRLGQTRPAESCSICFLLWFTSVGRYSY